ncbi:Coenzyme Q-binding protein coq10a, mitochondrial [Coemansia sp. RSA 922]|nr:Coenzyme Q-binding protein coq10a, mitochondrial [Coemansia sp. S17]KAJ2048504.1 Coenzyme Q-binding protein coq10a, mitochondrial [Coemansia sp. S2]KAJ2048848.1 Coenzyme Q-binding protein coq10a, mitochondrial [Coemansia sp. S16]KAJ2108790.1 Coenzyme Q-binding protein coq10a, mitochondrial [Coemansia sp. RSA 922]KAJ2330453.1 Coenzyme Q-binding protein coq10a, mitochondrial [Coemansia sp. RSA 2673]KAJ2419660.1 Coenzyme Q-binding protein coq10a, mitochondrial [Coemansia sp. RSA 2531]
MTLAGLRRLVGTGARTFFTLPTLGGLSLQKQYRDSLVFPFSCEQVFQVVSDVDRYCEFVPMCVGSKVLRDSLRTDRVLSMKPETQRAEPISRRCVQAELVVGYPPFNERYTSNVELDHPWRIVATATPGGAMFKHMRTVWEFVEKRPKQGDAPVSPFILSTSSASTLVSFSIEFEFASLVHAHTASLVFDQMAKRNLAAYLGRCQQLYGK